MSDTLSSEPVDISADTGADIGAVVDAVETQSSGIDAAIAGAFEKVEASPQVARDELGRFAAAEAAKQAAAEAGQQQTAPTAPGAPASWGKERAALFSALPPEAQAYIAQREEEISAGFKRYEGLGAYADMAEKNGSNLRSVLDTVKQLEDLVERDPVQGVMTICQRAGIDPVQLAHAIVGGQQAQQEMGRAETPAIPPQVLQTIQSLQREIETIRVQPYQREVETFAADPANKHFEKLSPVMAQLMTAEKGLSLRDAYDRAAWSDPQVRAELLAEQQKTAISQRNDQLAKTAQRASQASKGLAPSPPPQSLNGQRRFKTVDDAIDAAFAAHS